MHCGMNDEWLGYSISWGQGLQTQEAEKKLAPSWVLSSLSTKPTQGCLKLLKILPKIEIENVDNNNLKNDTQI